MTRTSKARLASSWMDSSLEKDGTDLACHSKTVPSLGDLYRGRLLWENRVSTVLDVRGIAPDDGGDRPPDRQYKEEPMKPTWRSRAACTGIDSDIFYPSSEDEAEAEPAKAICAACPVSTVCLEHALSVREKEGIWGGATETERRRMLRQRRQSA